MQAIKPIGGISDRARDWRIHPLPDQIVQFDPQPILAVLELKQHPQQPPAGKVETLFGHYLESIDKVVHAVDQHLRSLHPQREIS